MTDRTLSDYQSAINDFHAARDRADLQEILARLSGQNTRLLAFDEVRHQLRAEGSSERGLQDIPLEAIVGSVGRYSDFTRDFLPRKGINMDRWAKIKVAADSMEGLPPIDVYKIGETYFVQDGNHRVSVARQMGFKYIQAYVTEIQTRVPLTPEVSLDDLILKSEYVDFLEKTHLDQLRPGIDLSVTVPGQYPSLIEHISVHRYYMGIEQNHPIEYERAVTDWYDQVYLPIVRLIRQRGLLESFPGRTETDLYLWLVEHRAALEEELGWEVDLAEAAVNLRQQFSSGQFFARLGEKVLDATWLDSLESGPPAGQWRRDRLEGRSSARLFNDILTPVNGEAGGWFALEQALIVARRDGARLRGLHVVPSPEQESDPRVLAIQAEFKQRCEAAGIAGELVIVSGEISRQICGRARWTDLVIANLAYPPGPQPLARLSSGFRLMIQRSPRPVLAVPQSVSALQHALLAYDGSPKAEEALFVAAYLAGRWQIALSVVTVLDSGQASQQVLKRAQEYLADHQVQAAFIQENGDAAEAILRAGEANGCDLYIMGGYGYHPVLEVVLGSAVDQVLRESHKPILICR